MRPDSYVDNTPMEKTFEDLFVETDGNNTPVIGKISTSSNDPQIGMLQSELAVLY